MGFAVRRCRNPVPPPATGEATVGCASRTVVVRALALVRNAHPTSSEISWLLPPAAGEQPQGLRRAGMGAYPWRHSASTTHRPHPSLPLFPGEGTSLRRQRRRVRIARRCRLCVGIGAQCAPYFVGNLVAPSPGRRGRVRQGFRGVYAALGERHSNAAECAPCKGGWGRLHGGTALRRRIDPILAFPCFQGKESACGGRATQNKILGLGGRTSMSPWNRLRRHHP